MYIEADFGVVDAVHEVARERGMSAARVALARLFRRPAVVAPIVGAAKTRHVDDAVAAVDTVLSEEDVARLEAPYRPHPVLGH